jgi:hypothetical protein
MGSSTRLKRDSAGLKPVVSRFERDGSKVVSGGGLAAGEGGARPEPLITFPLASVVETVLRRTVVGGIVNFAYTARAILVVVKGDTLGEVTPASAKVVRKHAPAVGSLVAKNDRLGKGTIGFLPSR